MGTVYKFILSGVAQRPLPLPLELETMGDGTMGNGTSYCACLAARDAEAVSPTCVQDK